MASLMRSFMNQPPPALPHLRPLEMGPSVGVIKPSCNSEEARFTWKGERYIRCCALAQKAASRKQRTSIIWWYREDVVKEESDSKNQVWYCYLCEQQSVEMNKPLVVGEGNHGILHHLKHYHKINRYTGMKASTTTSSNTPSSADSSISGAFNRQQHLLTAQFQVFKDLLIRWIVYCHIAFFQLENDYFRKLIFWCSPGLERYLPKAAKTIRAWVMQVFNERREKIKQEMREAYSRIYISFDLWSSPNHKAIIGVIAHYITASGRRRNIAIGLREVFGEHAGENVSYQLLLLFKDYNITD